ncbi:DUF1007 family protein [Jannaschia aquimarina]|uniref:Polyphosphate kinase n=1 Tax=Jannaschia aquimarina TaxID=935700 RepID=A0A0D1CLW5_9RHOB|nr:DUF1007 family protein [Jannaschia aquimarina]KIT15762.1 hypothetical protein jaqu_25040 [Jannaschia aquimarina]SNT31865.1 ABC-type uncharacterized transport system, substrate-binding protein [Jannaschia aquimarina]
MRRMLLSVLTTALMSLGHHAVAHPHVFVDARTGFIFDDDGQLTGLRITWTYDALTSLFLFDTLDLDKDRDGELDDADRAAIAAGETDWPPEYNGDVYLEVDGAIVPVARPLNAEAWMEDDLISVAFDLPLAEIVSDPDGALLRLYDPIYYYAYTILPLEDETPGPCRAEVIPFEPDEATAELQVKLAALSREETPEQENVGALFADRVTLTCG